MVEAYGEQVVDKTLESCQAEAAAVEDSLDLAPGAAASVSALLSRHLSRRCAPCARLHAVPLGVCVGCVPAQQCEAHGQRRWTGVATSLEGQISD